MKRYDEDEDEDWFGGGILIPRLRPGFKGRGAEQSEKPRKWLGGWRGR